MNAKLLSRISTALRDATHRSFKVRDVAPVSGGSINEAFRLQGADDSQYFLKLNTAPHFPMFVAEAAGLDALAATGTLRLPRPIALGTTDEQSFLVLEHLRLNPRGDARQLGERLTALHRCSNERFGFAQDNFIGTTPQPNGWKEDWIDFWRERRLGFQLRLAAENGHGARLQRPGEELLNALPSFFTDYIPRPSLLHGDLWGGNHAYLADGTPAIFDPAVYFGDRECDIAMTELFGGFPADFYAAYRAAWPLDAGYAKRRDLYNLYHILNHANLFGGGYAKQAEQMMHSLLRQAKSA